MECASPAIEVVTLLWHPVVRQINYIRNAGDNMKELERKTDELASLENDVRDKVTSAEWKAKKTMAVVNNWLKNVKEMKDEASEIKKEFEENRRCLMGYLPNCCSQRNIGKRTLKLIEEVNELNKKGSFEDVVIASPPPATTQVMPTTSLVGSTAEQNFNRIWNILMEENSGIIGIYGMGGVGKTTVMENINNQLESTKKFDIVVWVTVSKDFNLKRLQSAIADRINLPKDLDEKASSIQLHEALRGKKFLLVLDDMWRPISLEQVGIPKPSVGNGCKVVLTTRSRRVCRSMEANKIIEIKKLSDEEAWLLFKEKVGASALGDSDVEVVAKQVANECDGLPLALITIGRALRDVKEVGHWRHALHQLKNSKPEIGEMEDEVIKILHFSYQYLKSDNLRACFLYCSLFPEDYHINKDIVINLWTCEGFIEEHGDTQAMVDEGNFLLNELLEACMLERSSDDFVKMHDLMRDMGIGITRKSPIFMVKAGIGLEKVVADKEWAEDVERISLRRNRIEMLSGEPPKCPKLLTLFLNDNPIRHFESPSFFQHMNQLRVLDLSETKIEELPESISSLENLHMLKLRCCRKLKTIPSLAKLKELRSLNLRYTEIQELPMSFSDLENLRELHASFCKKLNTIPCLAKLKELRTLDLRFTGMEVLSDSLSGLEKLNYLYLGGGGKLKSVPSLAKLKNLKTLDLSCTCIEELYFEIRECKGMECLLVAPDYDNYSAHHSLLLPSKVEKLFLFDMPDLRALHKGICLDGTLANLQQLAINSCPKLKSLFSLRMLQNFQNLKEIEIRDCIAMEEVVAGEEDDEIGFNTVVTLPNLESIELSNLPALQSICSRTMVCSSLINIGITSCCRLKKIPLIIDKPRPDELEAHLYGKREWWHALDWADLAQTKDLLESSFIEEEQTAS